MSLQKCRAHLEHERRELARYDGQLAKAGVGWGNLIAININASLADYYLYLVNKLSLAIMKMLSGANPWPLQVPWPDPRIVA